MVLHVLPKSWNKIFTEPDKLLVELLSKVAQNICDFRPRGNFITKFVEWDKRMLLVNDSLVIPKAKKVKNKRTEQILGVYRHFCNFMLNKPNTQVCSSRKKCCISFTDEHSSPELDGS